MSNMVHVKFQETHEINADGSYKSEEADVQVIIYDDYDEQSWCEWSTPEGIVKDVRQDNILKLIYQDFGNNLRTYENFWEVIKSKGGLNFCETWYSLEDLGYHDGIEDEWDSEEHEEEQDGASGQALL